MTSSFAILAISLGSFFILINSSPPASLANATMVVGRVGNRWQ
ncbi:MAG: hypothetical protein WCG61_03760 [Chlorobium sp.]